MLPRLQHLLGYGWVQSAHAGRAPAGAAGRRGAQGGEGALALSLTVLVVVIVDSDAVLAAVVGAHVQPVDDVGAQAGRALAQIVVKHLEGRKGGKSGEARDCWCPCNQYGWF